MNSTKEYWSSVTEHLGILRAIALHTVVPFMALAVGALPDATSAHESQIMNIVAILAGLLFATLVLLIDLRGRVRLGEDNRAQHGGRDTANLDYAYYVAHFAILLGLAIAGALLLQEQLTAPAPWMRQAANGVVFAACAEFALAVLHCLSRLRRAYEVFGKGNH